MDEALSTGADESGPVPGANARLTALLEQARVSHKALARRANELAEARGLSRRYTHTSVANWCRRGMVPRAPGPELVAEALGEHLARRVTVAETGLVTTAPHAEPSGGDGLAFHRSTGAALREAAQHWSTVHRRDFLTKTPFAVQAFSVPVMRWLIRPADAGSPAGEGRRVGASDVDELRSAAEEVRHWDSRFGGGSWRTTSVSACLYDQAAPMLRGSYSARVGAELFGSVAQLARLAGWTAFDAGDDRAAQRHFVQALRLARAAGDTGLGAYVMTTMAMQTLLRGHPQTAVDMTQAAHERVSGPGEDAVRGFARLIEARAHARAGEARDASRALAESEQLYGRAQGKEAPAWIDFFTHARIVTDAVEVYRDLGNSSAALRWDTRTPLPADRFTRCYGMRLAIVGSAHLQRGEVEQGVDAGRQAVAVLREVRSERAREHLRTYAAHLDRRRHAPAAARFLRELRTA